MRAVHIRESLAEKRTLCGVWWTKPEADPMVLLVHLAVHRANGLTFCERCIERTEG